MDAPRDPRDRLPPFLRQYCPDQQQYRLWSAKCRSVVYDRLARFEKACARGWSALGWTSRLLLVCVIAFVVFLVIAGTGSSVRYNVTDLGTFFATAMNNRGQVLGNYRSADSPNAHAFLWQADKGIQDLGNLGLLGNTHAINDAGQVVGMATVANGKLHAFLWQADSGMEDLGTLDGFDGSEAYSINNKGQVVGQVFSSKGRPLHAFLWRRGRGMQNLGSLGGDESESRAHAINDAGQVVGWTETANRGCHAFLWQADKGMQDLGTLGGYDSQARGINNKGRVVGVSGCSDLPGEPSGFGPQHVFLWQAENGMQDLGPLPATLGQSCEVRAVNNKGQVVGEDLTDRTKTHAFLYSDGKMIDLNTTIDPASGWHLSHAFGINDSGQIAGTGENKAGQSHAFLLTPITSTP